MDCEKIILQKAVDITKKRNDLQYIHPLRISVKHFPLLFKEANIQGYKNEEWLPALSIFLSLQYANSTREELARMPCCMKKYEEMCILAGLLNYDDGWKDGIVLQKTS